ncbi:MAG TPA: FlgD immunoglobulin-like domain containing protein, partial [bacterium]|nr:FlgD immunoglobulin-like domain containing protein [bacterium]
MGCAGLKPIPLRVYHLTFTLDQPALATAMVVDSEGNEVAVLWSNKAVSAGVLKVDWDGRDKDGKDVAPGSYRVLVSPIRYDLKPLGNFGGQGATPGRFLNPEGLCAYPQGARLTVAVADTGNNRVQLLTDQGGFLQSAGDFGSGEEALNHPTDVDWDGQILTVCDSQNHRLALFDGKGSFLSQVVKLTGLQTSLGGAPPVLDFQDPQCLRHDAGAFWVSDAGHGILFHVTNTGGVLDEIGAKFPLANDGPFLPVGGDFWVKTGRAQVQIVDSNGNVLDEVKADPPFKNVSGFAASAQNFNLISDTDNGLLYLVDNNGRVFESL